MASSLMTQLIVRVIDQASAPAKAISNAVNGISNAANAVSGRMAGLNARLTGAIERNNAALDGQYGRLIEAFAGFHALRAAINAPIQAASEFESAMADVKKVVDFDTPQAFKDFEKSVIEMSKRIPLAAQGLTQIVAAAGQAGIAREDLLKFTEMAAKIGVAFDISADLAGESMAKLMTGLGLSVDEVGKLADAMNHLSNSQASTAAEILDVVRRVGSSGKLFGFTATQTSAFASAMIAAGAQSDVAATSFSNMGRALVRGGNATKAQRDAYKKLGLDAKKVARDMQRDAVGTTIKVLEQINKLPKEMQAATASALFGDEARALMPLIANLGLLKTSLGLVAKETDYVGSAQKEYQARAATFANATQLMSNRIMALKIAIGNALMPALSALMGRLAPIVDSIAQWVTENPKLTAALFGVVAGLVAFRIAAIGVGYVALLAKGAFLSIALAAVRAATAIGAVTVAMTGLVARPIIAGIAALRSAMIGFAATAAIIGTGGAVKMLGASLLSLLSPLALVKGAFIALRVALLATGVGAVVSAIAAAGIFIYNNWSGLGEMFAAFGARIAEAFPALTPIFDALKTSIQTIVEWGSKLVGPIDATGAAWRNAGTAAADAVIGMINKLVEFLAFIAALPGKIVAALGEAGSILYNWGAQLIQGLIDGVKSKIAELTGVISGAARAAASAIGLGGNGGAGDRGGSLTGGAEFSGVDGARALGGSVSRGNSYLVGERGPEIFTANRTGTIIPNDEIQQAPPRPRQAMGASQPAPQTIAPNMTIAPTIQINGAQDPAAVAAQVKQALDDYVRQAMRGAFADYGARLA